MTFAEATPDHVQRKAADQTLTEIAEAEVNADAPINSTSKQNFQPKT
jgi:hypothetical protein